MEEREREEALQLKIETTHLLMLLMLLETLGYTGAPAGVRVLRRPAKTCC